MSASTFVHVCQQYSRLLIIARPVAAVTVLVRPRKEARSVNMNAGLLSFSRMNCVTMISEVRLFSIAQKDYVSLDSEVLLLCACSSQTQRLEASDSPLESR